MKETHKHNGFVRSDTGVLRSHSITQKHKDKEVQKWHDDEVSGTTSHNLGHKHIEKEEHEERPKVQEFEPIMNDGEIMVKLSKTQLEKLLNELNNSNAQEIGVSVRPR